MTVDSCVAHVLVGEPVSTSPEHALARDRRGNVRERNRCGSARRARLADDALAHVPAKWTPVRRQEHAPRKNLQPFPRSAANGSDSIRTEMAVVGHLPRRIASPRARPVAKRRAQPWWQRVSDAPRDAQHEVILILQAVILQGVRPSGIPAMLERWPSGRRRRFAKPLYGLKPDQGFESLPLRQLVHAMVRSADRMSSEACATVLEHVRPAAPALIESDGMSALHLAALDQVEAPGPRARRWASVRIRQRTALLWDTHQAPIVTY